MKLFESAPINGVTFGASAVYLILLCVIVLIYIGDLKRHKTVIWMLAAVALIYYPAHEQYIASAYGGGLFDIAGYMALPAVLAYTIFRIYERQESKRYRWITLVLGVALVFFVCSVDTYTLEGFRF